MDSQGMGMFDPMMPPSGGGGTNGQQQQQHHQQMQMQHQQQNHFNSNMRNGINKTSLTFDREKVLAEHIKRKSSLHAKLQEVLMF